MAITYLCTGGNSGDRKNLIEHARDMLETEAGTLIRASAIYESEAWGFQSDTFFYNQVLIIETFLKPEELLKCSRNIEANLGRERVEEGSYTSRTMDIDIIFYNRYLFNKNDLQIPHPRFALRRFVLEPLIEINPCLVDPFSGKTIWQLLKECPDKGIVHKLK